MNSPKNMLRASKIKKNRMNVRDIVFGEVKDEFLWDRRKQQGFSTIPRTLPHIGRILDALAGRGKPLSSTYWALWARVFDESFVEIKSPEELAFESGFSGNRAVGTWRSRMKILKGLGFINSEKGPSGEFHYVLIFNPYEILKKLKQENRIEKELYQRLFMRAQEIGASRDMEEDSEENTKEHDSND